MSPKIDAYNGGVSKRVAIPLIGAALAVGAAAVAAWTWGRAESNERPGPPSVTEIFGRQWLRVRTSDRKM